MCSVICTFSGVFHNNIIIIIIIIIIIVGHYRWVWSLCRGTCVAPAISSIAMGNVPGFCRGNTDAFALP